MTLREMINKPESWPSWPFLPVKRLDHSLENKNLGVLIDEHDGIKTVVHVNFFDLPQNGLENKPRTEYANLDAMIADGWQLD